MMSFKYKISLIIIFLVLVPNFAVANINQLPTVSQVVEKLGLDLYAGGTSGYCASTYKAMEQIERKNLPVGFKAEKYSLSSSIYYLLPEGNILKFHATKAAKQFHHYLGSAMRIIMIHENGALEEVILGKDILNKQQLHLNVPANTYLAAVLYKSKIKNTQLEYVLIGCTTSPSWENEDCIRATTKELTDKFPKHAKIIRQFT